MHQFDVHRLIGLRTGSAVDLAVIMQDDTLAHLSTRVVAPLIDVDNDYDIDRTTPAVEINGVRYIVAVHLLTTIPLRSLGGVVASLKGQERQIKSAIDMVFFGV